MTVTPWLTIDSNAVCGSKRSTSSTVAPAMRDRPSATFSPKMWNNGRTPKTTSSGPCRRPGWSWHCSRFESRLPWVSMAAFGDPAVPLVKLSTARSSGRRSTIGADGLRTSSSSTRAFGEVSPSLPITTSRAGRAPRSRPVTVARAFGPAITARAPMAASSLCTSGTGLDGLMGTATQPALITARYETTKYQLLAATMATRSPGSSPRPSSPPRRPATCVRSSP